MRSIRISHVSLALIAAVFVLGIVLPRDVTAGELAYEPVQKEFGRPQDKISATFEMSIWNFEDLITAPEPVHKVCCFQYQERQY